MSDKKKAIIFIICSAFFFALMNMFVRMSGDLPSVQKSFFRNFVAFFFALIILIRSKEGFAFDKKNLPVFIARAGFGTLGILCNFYAVDHLLLSDASILNKLSPFFAIVCSYFILKEKIKPVQAAAVAIAFCGALLVVKPGFSVAGALIPSLIGVAGGFCAGIAYTYVRVLGQRGERGPFIVLFFSAFSCIVTLPFLIFDFHPMSAAQVITLLLAGLSAAGGQFTITAAYTHAPAREVSVFDYTQIVFAAGLGFFFFGQIPDLWSILGYIIISGVAVAMFLYNILPGKR
ncbi:DMT family transporter [Ihubacter massiliensis]|uniref:DMT family transporter n=1 Tax=Hominibacterium faecale TaxID=2839743 RepID=A0A9J6QU07_9FIRM|nr:MULTISPECIES: DMT family transporter [Eubacteriales Family XIII. Incertae Sedis]MCO7121305.1 DMT family transporter [Ihubacter massiliensis]MCU7378291.1 DMT family transporter [Hominibacterium faecale]